MAAVQKLLKEARQLDVSSTEGRFRLGEIAEALRRDLAPVADLHDRLPLDLELDRDTITQAWFVAGAFPPATRQPGLPWTVHWCLSRSPLVCAAPMIWSITVMDTSCSAGEAQSQVQTSSVWAGERSPLEGDDYMTLASQARAALAGPAMALPDARATVPSRPGLYAVHGDAATWEQLGLGRPPDRRPLYVGKAERSLAGRDLRQHFAGSTGSSTLRRSLAALLRTRLGLAAVPRNPARPERLANYALDHADEDRLTAWIEQHLTLAVWVPNDPIDLGAVEAGLLGAWQPPLNLAGVTTPWTKTLRDARRAMAAQARAAAAAASPGDLVADGLPLNRKERYYIGTVLPMLVAVDDFAHLGRLTELVGLGPVQVDARPAIPDAIVLVETDSQPWSVHCCDINDEASGSRVCGGPSGRTSAKRRDVDGGSSPWQAASDVADEVLR